MKQGRNRKLWKQLRTMPPLSHWPDRSQAFDFEKSEVVKHIMVTRETNIRHAVSLFRQASRKRVIVFDTTTKLWCGNQDWPLSSNHEEKQKNVAV